jgi:hypothetical protein
MAKKSRRARRASRRAVQIRAASRALPSQTTTKVDFAEEYAYVLTDLKRIGLIALAMLIILITLAFIVA